MMSWLRSAADGLALNRNTTVLLAAIVLIGAGEELWMRFLPKYLETLGASVMLIGLFDAIKTLLGAVYAYPGGYITDRAGHRAAFLAFTAISVAGYAALLLFPTPVGVICSMFLFLAWTNFSLPATFSLVAHSLPAGKHGMGIGMQSLVRRIPVVTGPLLGGALIDRYGFAGGMRAGVICSIVMAALAVVMLNRLVHTNAPPKQPGGLIHSLRQFPPELRSLLLSDIVIRFCERLPFAWVVIYAMQQGVSATEAGMLTSIEMAAAIACYLPAAALTDRYGKEPFVVGTFLMFTAFPLILAISHSFPMLALAFAIRGLKEFGEPARKSLIVSYAPPDSKATTVGAYYLVRDLVVTPGAFAGAALWKMGPEVNFVTAGCIGLLATAVYVLSLRRHGRI